MNVQNNSFVKCQRILDRLMERKHFKQTAFAIFQNEHVATEAFITERDEAALCLNLSSQGGNKNHFVCSNWFDCTAVASSFSCNNAQRSYDNCGGGGSYQCNETDNPPFSCQHDNKPADYFDCSTFDCGVNGNGKAETYTCNSNVDFVCGGPDYDCVDNFDCTAAHGFFCLNQHDCEDQFTCSAGTSAGCGTPPVPVACVPGPNVDGYGGVPGGDGNNDPGDFLCALPGGTDDTFDCDKNFDCQAKSDFSCHNSGEFVCAQQSGSGSDTFRCSSTTIFECFERFECASEDSFNCDRPAGAAYNCKSSYAECKSKTEKDCKKDYQCKSNHGCPGGAPSTDHECKAPKFNCAQSGYDCAKSVPPYTPQP